MTSIELVLTEQIITTWSSEGRNKLFALAKTHWKGTSKEKGSSSQFRCVLYFLCQQAPNGKLKMDDVTMFLLTLLKTKEIAADREQFQSCLVDILCVLDAEVTCVSKEGKTKKELFCRLVKDLVDRKLLSETILKERFDFDTLEQLGVVVSAKAFTQKYVRSKTRIFYKQQKFNLFREENEGYAKLIVELEFSTRVTRDADLLLSHVQALIGQFSLDPNRVMDVILEVTEFYPQHFDFLVNLIRAYPSGADTLQQLLTFKLSAAKNSPDTDPPYKFFRMMALLMQSDVVPLEQMYCSLLPADSQVSEAHQKVISDAKKDSRATVTVQLENTPDKKELSDLLTPDTSIVSSDYMLSNQKICLLHAMLTIGDWEHASLLFQKLPEHYPVLFPSVRELLVTLIEFSIEPIYRKYAPRLVRGRDLEHRHNVFRYTSIRDLMACANVFEMCSVVGPYMTLHSLVLIKLIRVGRGFLKEYYSLQSKEQAEFERCFQNFISLIDEVILPSISLSGANCGLMEELWNMLKQYPYEIRYSIYGAWKNVSYSSTPILMRAKAIVIDNLRYCMKRLTKDNAKQIGRQLGKLVHSNSGVVFDYLLSQIQKFDNLIQPVVDAMKFLTNLAMDMLSYCIIEALSNPMRERMKQEDTNISSWLQCLAAFTGTLYRKYYTLGLTGLIQYVANQLKSGKSFDLLVLKEVVQKMSGIDISEDITDSQIEALLGGDLLKSEAGHFSQIRNIKRSSTRLRETLVEEHLGLPLCLLMAQHRNLLMFKDETEYHCKLLSHLYDQCQDTLVQFIDFMACHLSPEEYTLHVPGLNELASKYHIGADAAFYLLRQAINHSIRTNLLRLQREMESSQEKPKITFSIAKNLYIEAVDQSLTGIHSDTRLLYPDKVWEDITVHLFVAFWSLAPFDVITPVEKYEEEMSRIKNLKQEVDNNPELNSSKKKKEQEKFQTMIDKLQEELRQQTENHKLVLARIDHEKSTYFNTSVTRNRSITQFLQLCIFPRCCFTMTDALFCAQFVLMLHAQKTPHFSTLLFYDRVFSDISYTVTCCTENETRRYGKFLQAVLTTISKWHESKSTYERECSNTPGFVSMIRTSSDANENVKNCLDFENFRHICFKWHFKITKSLVICLESKDYIQIRNALIILTKLLPQYPKVHHLSAALEKRVDKIKDDEKGSRDDLFIIASSYIGKLKNHKNNLLSEAEYHKKDDRVSNALDSKRDPISSRDYKEPNKTAAQSNSKHPKSDEFQSQHKPRSNPTAQTTNASSKDYKDSASASRSNHDTHAKEATENGEDGLSERDPKRRKTDPNDKEKEINRIRERRDDSEKERKGERKRDRSREGSVENSKEVKRKRNEETAANSTEAPTKESSAVRTPKLNLKREPFVGTKQHAHAPPATNAQLKEGKPILLQKKKRDELSEYPRKHPSSEPIAPPIVTQAKKKPSL